MSSINLSDIALKGVCCGLPKTCKSVEEIGAEKNWSKEEINKITKAAGTKKIYIAENNQTASDICFNAASELLKDLNWSNKDIDGLIFISQTPDYILPATSCVMQNRLELKNECFTLDVNAGCSAFIQAYFLAAMLIKSQVCNKIIILIGNTLRNYIDPEDKTLTLEISDAGVALAFERSGLEVKTTITLNVDGQGLKDVNILVGGNRYPYNKDFKSANLPRHNHKGECLHIDGYGVFSFATRRIPKAINELMKLHTWEDKNINWYLFHQPSEYLLKYLTKKMGIDERKVLVNISQYGNTHGCSIPLLICDIFKSQYEIIQNDGNVIFYGFGVGFSWGGVATSIKALEVAKIIKV